MVLRYYVEKLLCKPKTVEFSSSIFLFVCEGGGFSGFSRPRLSISLGRGRKHNKNGALLSAIHLLPAITVLQLTVPTEKGRRAGPWAQMPLICFYSLLVICTGQLSYSVFLLRTQHFERIGPAGKGFGLYRLVAW